MQTELVGNLFQFGLRPALLIVLISVMLCVTASLLPAWRAARLDPVVAMRRT
jgi:ABC-type lipoprotein release transport system permease subunit